jgi:DNA-binding transcriptional LysR family regulator
MRHLLPFQYIDRIVRAGSIRGAAEYLAISPSALNRRVLSLEDELGAPIFERLPSGVRLSTAGEIFYRHIQTQLADFEEVRSRILDLTGLRAGHVNIAISPELAGPFLFGQIDQYLREFPSVTFAERIANPDEFEPLLADFSVDVALAFQPMQSDSYRTIGSRDQQVWFCVPETSELSRLPAVRLYHLIDQELIMPAVGTGLRRMLDIHSGRTSITLKSKVGISGTMRALDRAFPNAIRFDVSLNRDIDNPPPGFRLVPVDLRDLPLGSVSVGQAHQRTLPVAPAKFAEQLIRTLAI